MYIYIIIYIYIYVYIIIYIQPPAHNQTPQTAPSLESSVFDVAYLCSLHHHHHHHQPSSLFTSIYLYLHQGYYLPSSLFTSLFTSTITNHHHLQVILQLTSSTSSESNVERQRDAARFRGRISCQPGSSTQFSLKWGYLGQYMGKT